MRIEEDQLEADQSVEIRMIVPRSLVQEEDVPIGQSETDRHDPIEQSKSDSNRTWADRGGEDEGEDGMHVLRNMTR